MFTNTTDDWKLYEKGKEYNLKISYKENCDKNERFYAGDQWFGVKANNLPTPVFNVFKRITDHLIAFILSSPLKIILTSVKSDAATLITSHISTVWEREKMDIKLRELLLDCALTGDMATHTYWDENTYNSNGIRGDFVTECVDGINVFFGNVNDRNVQNQPYIIIAGRTMTEYLRQEALRHGLQKGKIKDIVPDEDRGEQQGERSTIEIGDKTTFIIKYYKGGDGKIWFSKSTKNVTIRENICTNLNRYPICFANWTKRKNSYHGQALGTGLIPNQIFINKIFAMAMKHMMDTAFPKAVYDKTRLNSWNNAVGSAIGVNGDIHNVAKFLEPSSMDAGVIALIDRAMQYTGDSMGATDVMLGQNIRPDNTSAIVALQQSAAIPLDNIKQSLYSFVEDLALIWLDFILNKYCLKRKCLVSNDGNICEIEIDPNALKEVYFNVRVDVGPSSYWSEITTTKTLDNLLNTGQIDIISYLQRLPQGYVPKVKELIEEIKKRNSVNE